MRRVVVGGSFVIGALLVAGMALAACGSSSSAPSQTQAAAGGQSAAPFAAGQSVAAKWTDGNLYLANVTSVTGDNVAVTYVDDGTSGTVPTSDVRAIPSTTFAVGDRVLAVWSKGRFYAGEVTAAEGATYTIKWDDGTQPSTVPAGRVIVE